MCNYSAITRRVRYLERSGAETGVIGKSLFGRDIYYVKVGTGDAVIITGAIHAREHATATLVSEQALFALQNASKLKKTFYFVPCVNPDGTEIACRSVAPPTFYSGDARLYKANGRGVDLNVNFDAGWGEGKSNVFAPAGENYVGEYPFSEPETAALRDFTLAVSPASTVSYHAKGREVYYDFRLSPERKERYSVIANEIAAKLGYEATGGDAFSAGGYKDWCEEKLQIPAFTIEIGYDGLAYPLNEKDLREDYARNIDLPLLLQDVV